MKREYLHALTTAIGMMLCAAAWAQSPRDEVPLGSGNFEESIAFADYLGSGDLRASELIGRRVLDEEGEEVGEIEDLIVSPGDETLTAILSVGGFLEVGSKLIGVSYDELRVSPEGEDFYLAMSAEEIEARPEYLFEAEEREAEERETESFGASQDDAELGATGTPGPEERAAGEAAADVVVEQREQREAVSRRTVVAQRDDPEIENESAPRDGLNNTREDSGQAGSDRSNVEASTTGQITEERSSQHRAAAGQSEGRGSESGEVRTAPPKEERAEETDTLRRSDLRASELIGMKVVTTEGEEVGKIDDLIVSTEDRSMRAVLAIGGLLGVGERLIGVSFEELRLLEPAESEEEQPFVRLEMTVDELRSRPIFQYQDTQVSAAGPLLR